MPFHEKKRHRILEFQSRLLKEFSLTSGSLTNRGDQFRNIAAAAREVMDVCFLYTFQRGNDDRYELEFFWPGRPSAPSQETALHAVRDALRANPSFNAVEDFSVVHSYAATVPLLPDLTTAELTVPSKPFFFDTLDLNGMVGAGLAKSPPAEENIIAVDTILIALINLVTSARALTAYKREAERFATRDPLTNLYNQISFWDLLQYETERSKRQRYKFSLLTIDIDNFKAVNDTYGHDVGDTLLKEFSSVLKTAVRGGDIAARYAGDQFAAILPVCDEGQAYIVARRIIENLREFSLTLPNGTTVKQTVSIGVAVFPDHAKEAKDLYLLADSMLMQAKTFGKDRLSMPSEHDDVEILKSMGEKNILIIEALSQRQIVPYFQPIMNMKDRKIEAYEVLTRIIKSGRVIPAEEFIETAENMGAIGKIDYRLIELALSKVKESSYRGMLFLNLSPKALVLNEFIPTVRTMLKNYNLDPSRLVFEITERDTIKGLSIIEKYIHDLKREGFRFAIDDFGAGYSTFHYLKTFSIDYLKIDGEFIRNMDATSPVERAIVASITGLAGKLGIKTIAEFVETEAILGEVEAAGIDYAQGYYIKKPSPDLP
jgi:diguanylate cyclase (GGDEF)-like protein